MRTQEVILGKPFTIKGKNQQSFAIDSREYPPHHKPQSTQEGASMT
jgi:hypothetical protein